MVTKKKSLTVKEMATLGGKATFKKYGKKHYKEMGEKRWKNAKKVKKTIKK